MRHLLSSIPPLLILERLDRRVPHIPVLGTRPIATLSPFRHDLLLGVGRFFAVVEIVEWDTCHQATDGDSGAVSCCSEGINQDSGRTEGDYSSLGDWDPWSAYARFVPRRSFAFGEREVRGFCGGLVSGGELKPWLKYENVFQWLRYVVIKEKVFERFQ